MAIVNRDMWNDTININETQPIDIFIVDVSQRGSSTDMIIYGCSTENTTGVDIGPIFNNPTGYSLLPMEVSGSHTPPTTIPNLGMRLDGIKYSLTGAIPQPKLTIDKVRLATDASYIAALAYWNTTLVMSGQPFPWLGGIVCRVRTNADYQTISANAAHPNYWAKVDKFVVKEIASNTDALIELALTPAIGISEEDESGRVIADSLCSLRYRVPDPSTTNTFYQFDLADGGCPYVGSNYYKPTGISTTSWVNDQCGKRIEDCLLRFGSGALPFTGKL